MVLSWEAAVQSLNGIIQLHFEKDAGEEAGGGRAEAGAVAAARRLLRLPGGGVRQLGWGWGWGRMACRHVWAPVGLLTLGHAASTRRWRTTSAASTASATSAAATSSPSPSPPPASSTSRPGTNYSSYGGEPPPVLAGEIEIPYQEPPESYLGKFKRSWAMHFGFLMCTFGFMVSSAVVILCF
uniref:Uncharacterized protein n=1 Tax=Ananas comosus var. bracteatus TaxID=296719 RepID=A0A6V7Q6R9_ANACO|nr:unnamed protein product [Ananas comosus var. bracteatus]